MNKFPKRNITVSSIMKVCLLAGIPLLALSSSAQNVQVSPLENVKKLIEDHVKKDGGAADGQKPDGIEPSPEPGEISADAGTRRAQLPEPSADGGKNRKVTVIPIEDTIDMGLASFVERVIRESSDSAAIILDINTPGGRVDAALLIRDALMDSPVKTAAWVHPRAISAGAFISLACDYIFMVPGGSIGAATPIAMSGPGQATAVDEKMVSYFRTEMASTARAKGRRGDLAEAMVDPDIEIEGIIKAGKLLTLDTDRAVDLKLADALAKDINAVLELLGLGGADIKESRTNWAEKIARIFTHPIVSGILMTVGMAGILIELYTPGVGLPGAVGVTALLIFFLGHMVVQLAGIEELLLFAVGVGLIATEVFVTPGFGLLGVAGILVIISSLVLSLLGAPIDISWDLGLMQAAIIRVGIAVISTLALFLAAVLLLPRTRRIGGALVLNRSIVARSDGDSAETGFRVEKGNTGIAASDLRPAGKIEIDGERIDVTTEGEYVEKGREVKVVKVSGNRVVVRAVNDSGKETETS